MSVGTSHEIDRGNAKLIEKTRGSSQRRYWFVLAVGALSLSIVSFLQFPVALASAGTDSGASSNGAWWEPVSVFTPPAGFNPVTASSAELAEFGFPRPSGGPALSLWQTALSKVKDWESPNPIPGTNSMQGTIANSATGQNGFTSINNSNWAGHQVPDSDYGNVKFDYTEAEWTVPAVPPNSSYPTSDCHQFKAPMIGIWDGIGSNIQNPNARDILQDGTVACSTSSSQYGFWTDDAPENAVFEGPAVFPGDQVFTEVNYNNNDTTTYLLENLTTGVGSLFANISGPDVDLTTTEFILEHPGGSPNPLPDFGVVNFSSCYFINANGDTYELTANNNIIQMTDGDGVTLTGGVSGGGFSVTWESGT